MKQTQPNHKNTTDPTLSALLRLAHEQQTLAQTSLLPRWLSPTASFLGQHIFFVSVVCSFVIAMMVFVGWFRFWLTASLILFRLGAG